MDTGRLKNTSACLIAAILLVPFATDAARDQHYPVRPIRLVVPSTAGGGMDTLARTIGRHLTEQWRRQVVVDARSGATGVDIVHVPCKGTPPALIDLMAGRVQLMFAAAAPALPHIKSAKLRAVAVTTAKQSPNLPDIPAVAETVAGFDAETWYSLPISGSSSENGAR